MQRYVLALVLICLSAIVAILVLRPDPALELEATLSRIEPQEALERLNAGSDAVPETRNLLLLHARLATAAGELATARAAYGRMIEIDGPSPTVLDEMADVAALSGDLGTAADLKAEAQALDPDPERRAVLGYWYRVLGRPAEETALLSSVAADALTAFERARLAELHLARDDVGAYRDMLTVMSDTGGDAALAARRELLELTLGEGAPEEALSLGTGWFDAAPEDGEALGVSLRTMLGRGAVDQATALAFHAIATNAEIGAIPTEVFVAAGHGGTGRQLQTAWLSSDTMLDADDWEALVGVAERTGDLRALQASMQGRGAEDAPIPSRAFLQFLRYQGPQSLLPLGGAITAEVFEDEPLVGAAWHGWHRRFAESYDYLLAAAAGPLTDWDRSIWISVAGDLRGTPFFRELLAGAPQDARLREMLARGVRAPVEITR